MNKLLTVLFATLFSASVYAAAAAPAAAPTAAPAAPAADKKPAKTKKVCVDKMKDGKPVKDKDGKTVQQCKEVKVHEKLEGTKVPEKK